MPYYCTVPRCTSMAGKAKNVSFHQFPRDEELAKLWNRILKRGKPYTKYSKVCSLHFTPEDYTITSVGKNKGQWRTLRKDAVPSQNLPSESPTPYQRKQWGAWSHNTPASAVDPALQQQVAQAIYMQTMLAMQAAGATEIPNLNHGNGLPPPLTSEAFAHTSTISDTDILKGKQINTDPKSTSYKCMECSKCFKDPDVFILHKRSHIKNEKNEKENFNLNVTLQANPILANLLKTNSENANIFDNNLISVESLLMTALAANMEGYMRNFTSMIKGDNREMLDHDKGESDHDRNGLDRGSDNSEPDINDSDHDNNDLDPDLCNKGNLQSNIDFTQDTYNKDCQSTSQRGSLDHDSSLGNNRVADGGKDVIQIQDLISQDHGIPLLKRDNNVFQNRILDNFRNNTYDSFRNVRYYENDNLNNDSSRNCVDKANCSRGVVGCDRNVMDHDSDRNIMNHDTYKKVTNDYSQGSNNELICDSDLNESIDSHKLVIDENV